MKARARGFSLVEVIVVFGILVLMVSTAIIGFQNYARYQSFDQAVAGVKATLADTKIRARSSEGGQGHGLKIFTSSIVVFPGTTYSAGNSSNETYTFDAATLTPTLTGGNDEIIFSNLTGLPSATGTILMTGVTYTATRTVEITGTGVIQ